MSGAYMIAYSLTLAPLAAAVLATVLRGIA